MERHIAPTQKLNACTPVAQGEHHARTRHPKQAITLGQCTHAPLGDYMINEQALVHGPDIVQHTDWRQRARRNHKVCFDNILAGMAVCFLKSSKPKRTKLDAGPVAESAHTGATAAKRTSADCKRSEAANKRAAMAGLGSLSWSRMSTWLAPAARASECLHFAQRPNLN